MRRTRRVKRNAQSRVDPRAVNLLVESVARADCHGGWAIDATLCGWNEPRRSFQGRYGNVNRRHTAAVDGYRSLAEAPPHEPEPGSQDFHL